MDFHLYCIIRFEGRSDRSLKLIKVNEVTRSQPLSTDYQIYKYYLEGDFGTTLNKNFVKKVY